MRLCYDIETNGLDPDTIWVLVAQNLDTDVIYKFSDHDNLHGSIRDGISLLENAELLVGHNIIGFDNRVIDNLYGTNLNSKRCHDTFIMSQTLRYKRSHRHGLAGWGEALGNSKGDYNDWSNYNKEMLKYCIQDVKVNVDVYNRLLQEYSALHAKNPLIKKGLEIEHDAAKFNTLVKEQGWKFDTVKAEDTRLSMLDRMFDIENVMHPKLGMKTVYIDKEPRTPKFKKNGEYNVHTVKQLSEFFGKAILPTDTHLMPAGKEFQRTEQKQIDLGSTPLVKEWLLDNGWIPDEYNRKKVDGRWITQTDSPKFTTASLEKMGPYGKIIDEYYTIRSRKAVVEGWLAKVQDGRLNGNMWTIGTATFRARHEVIVNLPAVTAEWGHELRELLIADDGMVVVGADSSGNQLRGLCHYVNNSDFTREVIYGDQHQRNADSLGCSRALAKSYLYAYLFGAGDAKLGQVLTGKSNSSVGKKSRDDFARGIRGLQELKDSVSKTWKQTSFQTHGGWFPALDGRPVFCPSEYQTLNYLLQSAEGITCKAALSWAMNKIEEEGIDAQPRLWYHDEMCFQCKPEDAERVGQILQEAYAEGPKWFNVDCMGGGDPVQGTSYADVH